MQSSTSDFQLESYEGAILGKPVDNKRAISDYEKDVAMFRVSSEHDFCVINVTFKEPPKNGDYVQMPANLCQNLVIGSAVLLVVALRVFVSETSDCHCADVQRDAA